MRCAILIERRPAATAVSVLLLAAAFALAPRAAAEQVEPSRPLARRRRRLGNARVEAGRRPGEAEREGTANRPSSRSSARTSDPVWARALPACADEKTAGPAWYRISVTGGLNGRTGWVCAASLELRPVHKQLVIYRGARRFEFWDRGRLVRSGTVAVGKSGAETPLGLFYVTDKFDPTIDPDWAILGA